MSTAFVAASIFSYYRPADSGLSQSKLTTFFVMGLYVVVEPKKEGSKIVDNNFLVEQWGGDKVGQLETSAFIWLIGELPYSACPHQAHQIRLSKISPSNGVKAGKGGRNANQLNDASHQIEWKTTHCFVVAVRRRYR
jgi:hypothetical protein